MTGCEISARVSKVISRRHAQPCLRACVTPYSNAPRDDSSVWPPQLNKDTNDLLWLAIVGLTDQYIHQVRVSVLALVLWMCGTQFFVVPHVAKRPQHAPLE